MIPFKFDNPDNFVNGTPHGVFAQLRKEAPFAWHDGSDPMKGGFWLATKYHDVVAISRNPKLFATHAPLLADPLPKSLWPEFPSLAMIADNLMTFDHQKHAPFRAVANALFSAARIADLERKIRSRCMEVMARISGRSSFDFAAEVALAIPVEIVLGVFLGVPEQDLEMVTRSVLTINAMDDPVFRPNEESLLEAAEKLFAYSLALLERLKTHVPGSLLSDLLHTTELGALTAQELLLAYWFPLAAGAFDTTASTIAGGVQALLQHPQQLSELQTNPSLIPLAVDEMLRWVSPVVYFRRTATADTCIDRNQIMKGQKIVLCYASANRDEEVFSDPDSFCVTRNPNNHLAFGYGPHFCLGARLAYLILRIFLEEFGHRLSSIRLDGDVARTRSGWMNRIRYMPVRYIDS